MAAARPLLRGRARVYLPLAALLLVAAALAFGLRGRRTGPPNVILIVWDTCRVDRLSAFGYGRPTTPWLESFCRDAVRYTGCIAPAPWTAPSHASLFTGLRPSRHGLRVELKNRVRPGIPLLASSLRKGGYATVGISANGVVSAATGLDEGFDTFAPAFIADEKPPASRTAAVARETLEKWLAAPGNSGKPLFLFVNFLDAHLPHDPPPWTFRAAGIAGPPAGTLASMREFDTKMAMSQSLGRVHLDPDQVAALGDLYDADLASLDRVTGVLFTWLEEKGLLQDSLVAIVSDHGENLGEHDEFGHRLSVHEPLLRVPLVVRWPDGRDPGSVRSDLVSLMDLHPTILAEAGIPTPPHTGTDAVPLTAASDPERLVPSEYGPQVPFIAATRASHRGLPESAFDPLRWLFQVAYKGGPGGPEWKLERRVRFRDDGTWTPVETLLYNLAADPGEKENLLQGTPPPGIRDMAKWLEGGLDAPALPLAPR